jgi:hypothetical protein
MHFFDVHTFPQYEVVYCVFVNNAAVYIGEGNPKRLVQTLYADFPDLLTFDASGGHTGSTALRYLHVDPRLVTLLPVPAEMQQGGPRKTLFSTNVENVLIALLLWQTDNCVHVPPGTKTNKVQNSGDNKGGWIADCQGTLERFFLLYQQLGCPVCKPWPQVPAGLPQVNPDPTTSAQFLAVWSSIDTSVTPHVVKLNIGFCKVNNGNVPHMSQGMTPAVQYSF